MPPRDAARHVTLLVTRLLIAMPLLMLRHTLAALARCYELYAGVY